MDQAVVPSILRHLPVDSIIAVAQTTKALSAYDDPWNAKIRDLGYAPVPCAQGFYFIVSSGLVGVEHAVMILLANRVDAHVFSYVAKHGGLSLLGNSDCLAMNDGEVTSTMRAIIAEEVMKVFNKTGDLEEAILYYENAPLAVAVIADSYGEEYYKHFAAAMKSLNNEFVAKTIWKALQPTWRYLDNDAWVKYGWVVITQVPEWFEDPEGGFYESDIPAFGKMSYDTLIRQYTTDWRRFRLALFYGCTAFLAGNVAKAVADEVCDTLRKAVNEHAEDFLLDPFLNVICSEILTISDMTDGALLGCLETLYNTAASDDSLLKRLLIGIEGSDYDRELPVYSHPRTLTITRSEIEAILGPRADGFADIVVRRCTGGYTALGVTLEYVE